MITRFFGMDIHQEFALLTTRNDALVLEVTTNTWYAVDVLEQYVGRVVVANPYKTRLIAEAHIKNDKVDALALARLLSAGFICEVWVPNAETRQWRILAQHRATLQRHCTQVKNRLHSLRQRHNLHCPTTSLFSRAGRQWLRAQAWPVTEALAVRQDLAQLELLEAQLHEVDQQIASLAAQDARIARLLQINGIGVVTAFAILAVIGDIRRFPAARKLTSYVGLVPRQHQSGQRGYFGHITKAGASLLRWLLVEAAQAAVRWDPHWQAVHARIARRRGAAIATVAVARKLLVVIWHMLTEATNYQHLRSQSYVTKLQNWAYAIGRQQLPAASSKDFVTQALRRVELPQLAAQVVSQKGTGRLLIQPSSP